LDHISQFIVDLSWGLTFGALIAVGILAAEAAGVIFAGLVALALGGFFWRRWRRRSR
jgi:LPXTG-motif cell wall-anchored protein